MVEFDPNTTEIIFFDLQFYVPKEDRERPGPSFVANPCIKTHRLLGGVFAKFKPKVQDYNDIYYQHFWIWKTNNTEKVLLTEIYNYFQRSWDELLKENDEKRDLILCGNGISSIDIPYLYVRSVKKNVATPEKIFNCYCKTKQVDLSNVAIPYLNQDNDLLYPVSTDQLIQEFTDKDDTISSESVWDQYDIKQHKKIARRTKNDLKDCITIYQRILDRIDG